MYISENLNYPIHKICNAINYIMSYSFVLCDTTPFHPSLYCVKKRINIVCVSR